MRLEADHHINYDMQKRTIVFTENRCMRATCMRVIDARFEKLVYGSRQLAATLAN